MEGEGRRGGWRKKKGEEAREERGVEWEIYCS